MLVKIGKGPDYRVTRGREILNYKFEMKLRPEMVTTGPKILTHRSLAMIAREIYYTERQWCPNYDGAIVEIDAGKKRLGCSSRTHGRIWTTAFLGPAELTPVQEFNTIENLRDLYANLRSDLN